MDPLKCFVGCVPRGTPHRQLGELFAAAGCTGIDEVYCWNSVNLGVANSSGPVFMYPQNLDVDLNN